MLRKLWNDDVGMVISAELALILTIGVIAVMVGLSEAAIAINTEMNDISNAVGSLDQSFFFTGMTARDHFHGKLKAYIAGSRYHDAIDDCDRNQSCDIVCGVAHRSTGG